MKRFIYLALATSLCLTVIADEDQVEYRQEIMSAIGGSMGALGKILKEEVDRTDDIAQLAVVLDELATIAQHVFPEGSEGGEALLDIWQEPEEFEERLTAFKTATAAFRKAAESGEMANIGPTISEVGMACRGCHQQFRE
ncbi:MAG: cytochrome c [Gammaproteobacteria bacterium]|nr:cytochrome c [Gammaproteobacteria bacterium]